VFADRGYRSSAAALGDLLGWDRAGGPATSSGTSGSVPPDRPFTTPACEERLGRRVATG
jgi:hypothetical protein